MRSKEYEKSLNTQLRSEPFEEAEGEATENLNKDQIKAKIDSIVNKYKIDAKYKVKIKW